MPHQQGNLDIGLRPQLAGQPHIRGRADALQCAALIRAGRRKSPLEANHPHPTGRAAGAAATQRKMRDVVFPACFKNGPASGDMDRARRVPNGYGSTASPLADRAHESGNDDCAEEDRQHLTESPLDLRERCQLSSGENIERGQARTRPDGIGRQDRDFPPKGDKTHERKRGQKHGGCKKEMKRHPVPASVAQHEMNAEAAMRPRHRHEDELLESAFGRPHRPHQRRIGLRPFVQLMSDACRGQMRQ